MADPDEIFPDSEIERIDNLIDSEDVGGITVKIENYFLGDKVKFGRWAPYLHDARVIRKNAIILPDNVHDGINFKPGYKTIEYKQAIIKHYWIDSIEQFYKKHNRYLQFEGERRYKNGERFSTSKSATTLLKNFFLYGIRMGGIFEKNGPTLTFLALWYDYNSFQALRRYQSQHD